MASSIPVQYPVAGAPPRVIPRWWANGRMAARIALVFGWTSLFLVTRLALWPLRLWAPPRVDWRIREAIQKVWGEGTRRIMGIRLTVHGEEPKDPYFLVSNHLSYVDIILYSCCVRCIFVAMKEMRGWPLIGYTISLMQTIFIDRFKPRDAVRVNDAVTKALTEGKSVIMFPEATTTTGHEVLPFRGAILDAAVRLQHPVHYATIQFHPTPSCPHPGRTVAWVDETPFGDHVRELLRARRMEATITFAPEPITAPTRKELALKLEQAVRRQLMGGVEDNES
jgi:1-acyl-sn-glycerol-3-phosphate acyltransferase